ncbi:MAG: hypothetical protein ACJ75H_05005 [Thermoanaerobaculia bacterium]
MPSILRSILAVLCGALVGGAVILGMELVGTRVFPPPASLAPADPESMRAAMAALPLGAFVMVLAGWALGTFAGAWVAARVAGRSPLGHGLAVGLLFLAAGVANMLSLPHPVWFWVVGVLLFLPAGYLGGRLAAGGGGHRELPAAA